MQIKILRVVQSVPKHGTNMLVCSGLSLLHVGTAKLSEGERSNLPQPSGSDSSRSVTERQRKLVYLVDAEMDVIIVGLRITLA